MSSCPSFRWGFPTKNPFNCFRCPCRPPVKRHRGEYEGGKGDGCGYGKGDYGKGGYGKGGYGKGGYGKGGYGKGGYGQGSSYHERR